MDVGIVGLRDRSLRQLGNSILVAIALFCVVAFDATAQFDGIVTADSGAAKAKSVAVLSQPADVMVNGRAIARLHSSLVGSPPSHRVVATQERIEEALTGMTEGKLQVVRNEAGFAIMLDGRLTLFFTDLDHDPISNESIEQVVQRGLASMSVVVKEYREARSLPDLLRGIAFAVIGAALFYFIIRLALWGRGRLLTISVEFFEKRIKHTHVKEIIAGTQILSSVLSRLIALLAIIVIIIAAYFWISLTFDQFPATRPYSQKLAAIVTDGVMTIVRAVIDSIPNLLMVVLIFFAARYSIMFLDTVMSRVERGQIQLSFIESEGVLPTRKVLAILIWIFAFALAYPFIPGSSTDAFKGVSVIVGLMFSLGASSTIGQVISGLSIMYTRTLKVGDWVTLNDTTGRVARIGFFNTRLTTAYNDEIIFPNSQVVTSKLVNHSRVVSFGVSYSTTVTIGYDAPWRLVHKLLITAANKTSTVAVEPAPFVTQKELSDFFVVYKLTVHITDPTKRRFTVDTLHSNIQDQFNENNVQIMSPHYYSDPNHPKVVDKKNWDPPAGGNPSRQSGFL